MSFDFEFDEEESHIAFQVMHAIRDKVHMRFDIIDRVPNLVSISHALVAQWPEKRDKGELSRAMHIVRMQRMVEGNSSKVLELRDKMRSLSRDTREIIADAISEYDFLKNVGLDDALIEEIAHEMKDVVSEAVSEMSDVNAALLDILDYEKKCYI